MKDEAGLSAENRALIEQVFSWATPEQLPITCFPAIRLDELERLLNAARSSGQKPFDDGVREKALERLRLALAAQDWHSDTAVFGLKPALFGDIAIAIASLESTDGQ